jgi:capsular exopolysaccharide synthesis family protein
MNNRRLPPPESDEELSELYPPEPEMHLRDYFYVLIKRRWLILAITTAVAAIATVRALVQTPMYSSTAVVQITRGKLSVVSDVVENETWIRELYPTQQRVLTSRTLAQRVVDHTKLWQHPLYGSSRNTEPSQEVRDALAAAVQSMVSVNHVRETQLLEVKFTTPDPELSARLANTLVRQYMSFSGEAQTDVARNTASFIREQIEKLQQDIQAKEQILQDYSRKDDIVMVDQKESMVVQKLEGLNGQLTQAQGRRVEAEALYKSLRSTNPAQLPEVQSNASIQALKNQRAVIQKEYAELSAKFKPEWPELRRTQAALEDVERELERETQEVVQEVVAAARVEYQSALKRERLLSEAVEEQKGHAQDLNTLTADYNRINAELENQRHMLQQLLRRHSETGLSADIGQQQPVNVRLVERAVVPKGPSQPNIRRKVSMGILFGLALALGTAFFLDYWDTSIHTIDDLRRYVALPYLGMVPRYGIENGPSNGKGRVLLLPQGNPFRKQLRTKNKDLSLTRSSMALTKAPERAPSSKDDWSVIGERFKFIRGSLLLSTPGSPPRTVLVTGPDKNAGKTFVACNLAVSLAELGKKVLIIDADLRNPQIHRVFRYRNKLGLSNVLAGQTGLEGSTVYTTSLPNVYVMLAGPPCPAPAELLGSRQMETFLTTCTKHFDYVLLDSAPLLPVFDSHVLTAKCDAALLVVRSGHTSRFAVKSSLDFINRVGGKISGVVLNDVNLGDRAQNYYYSYHTYEYGTYYAADQQERRA